MLQAVLGKLTGCVDNFYWISESRGNDQIHWLNNESMEYPACDRVFFSKINTEVKTVSAFLDWKSPHFAVSSVGACDGGD